MSAGKIAGGTHSRGLLHWLFRIIGAVALAAGAVLRADELSSRVVVLANSDDPGSVRIAQHYAEARDVPPANIIALPMARAETIAWPEFIRTIWEPLRKELVRRSWIDGIAMDGADPLGRTKYAITGHRIAYLVVCRGVPLRIMHDPDLYKPVVPFTNTDVFRTNAGAVDSELSLLAYQALPINRRAPDPNYAINAFIPNPLFRNDRPSLFEAMQVVKVSRLDGPTEEEANELVDRAIAAERNGLLGRAYIDLGGRHPDGDRWLTAAANQLRDLGFDIDIDRAPSTMPATARIDAPAIYLGWYASDLNGPFALPGFRFPPGAIALHIHSYSAATLHAADQHWCGPLVARGVTATVGNVFEPYLAFTHRPDFLVRALARGDTWGDAVFYAMPVLSWQAIAIGDPLYRPFAVPFDLQFKNRAQLPARLAGYAVLRRMNQLEAAHQPDDALALARGAQREQPSFAVGVALAERLEKAGDKKAAAAALGFVPLLGSFPTDEWGLAYRAATLLAADGKPREAVTTLRTLFKTKSLPRELRLAWLPEADKIAQKAQDNDQAQAWALELSELKRAAAPK